MLLHLISSISFGLIPILYKSLLLFNIDSITILFLTKILIAFFCIILLLFSDNYKIIQKYIKNITANNAILFKVSILVFLAGFIYFYGQYNYILLLKTTQTNISTIIIACYPVITILLSYYYFNEKIDLNQFIGILLIFSGLAFIAYK